MSAVDIRRPLYNKLITDFTALKHLGGSLDCFAAVEKIFIDFPTQLPACEILLSTPSTQIQGNDWDSRILSFRSVVYELMEVNINTADAEMKIDRLSDIEDRIFDYLQKIPNNLEHAVTGVHVFEVMPLPSRYFYEQSEEGMKLYQTIDFDLKIIIDVKSL